ncbi:PREDICTED: protein Churchill-like isoform X1 [Branchiostoma belcheri]|uniref:Protein Churchill n=1 Tax=Branchiostoma belcheri TaxID=7741 RepID=A0A6P5A965_BRABE|nr:PREDICTED: protein Churchill-like isoform X1 [Branchiostoma belcheri]
MCQNCVNNVFPDRGHTCLESGSYLMNFASCAQCNKKELIKIHNKEEREEEQEQVITYQHLCQNCDHVIAEHEYRFCVEEGYQEYQMTVSYSMFHTTEYQMTVSYSMFHTTGVSDDMSAVWLRRGFHQCSAR